jgi:hypothetical protein
MPLARALLAVVLAVLVTAAVRSAVLNAAGSLSSRMISTKRPEGICPQTADLIVAFDGQSSCACSYGFRCMRNGTSCSSSSSSSSRGWGSARAPPSTDKQSRPRVSFAPESYNPHTCLDCTCAEDPSITREIPNTLFSMWSSRLVRGARGGDLEADVVGVGGGGGATTADALSTAHLTVESATSREECAVGLNVIKTAQLNKDLKFSMLDDEACVVVCLEVFPALVPFFNAEPRGQYRGDVCRGCMLLRYGGFYVDADVEARERIRDVVPRGTHLVLPWGGLEPKRHTCMRFNPTKLDQYTSDDCNAEVGGNTTPVVVQNCIGASPGHPVIRRYLEIMLEMKRGQRAWSSWMGTNAMGIAYAEFIAAYFGGGQSGSTRCALNLNLQFRHLV